MGCYPETFRTVTMAWAVSAPVFDSPSQILTAWLAHWQLPQGLEAYGCFISPPKNFYTPRGTPRKFNRYTALVLIYSRLSLRTPSGVLNFYSFKSSQASGLLELRFMATLLAC